MADVEHESSDESDPDRSGWLWRQSGQDGLSHEFHPRRHLDMFASGGTYQVTRCGQRVSTAFVMDVPGNALCPLCAVGST